MKLLKFLKQNYFFIFLILAFIASFAIQKINAKLCKETTIKTYSKAWADGANASTEAHKAGNSWNDSLIQVKFKKDSLAFIGLIYSEK